MGKNKALRCGFRRLRQVPSLGHQRGSSGQQYQYWCLLAQFLVHLKHVNLFCVEDRFHRAVAQNLSSVRWVL
jgi:hypothetical protein